MADDNTKTTGSRTWSTDDMSLAAWMLSRGKKIESVSKVSNGQCYVFLDEENSCMGLVMEFVNSDAHTFDQAMRTLKKLRFISK